MTQGWLVAFLIRSQLYLYTGETRFGRNWCCRNAKVQGARKKYNYFYLLSFAHFLHYKLITRDIVSQIGWIKSESQRNFLSSTSSTWHPFPLKRAFTRMQKFWTTFCHMSLVTSAAYSTTFYSRSASIWGWHKSSLLLRPRTRNQVDLGLNWGGPTHDLCWGLSDYSGKKLLGASMMHGCVRSSAILHEPNQSQLSLG